MNEAKTVNLSLPPFMRFKKGMRFMHRGVPYEVLSAAYNAYDGWSFGAGSEDWYQVRAKDLSDTDAGKKMIAYEEREKLESELKGARTKAGKALRNAVQDRGSRYTGERISIDRIPGITLVDTFNIYGGGIIIRYMADTVWLIVNNGADRDDWSINNIRTGGAGAYAYSVPTGMVKNELQVYRNVEKTYADNFPDV